jgi:tRNA threonylcarbamoyladenosine biosynthesis protein TsaB
MPTSRLICSLLDARNNQVYAGLYRMGPEGVPQAERADCLTDVTRFLPGLAREEIVFLGGGAMRHAKLIHDSMNGRAILHGGGEQRLMASAVGLIGLRRYRMGATLDTLTFTPRYLRVSEAEATYGKLPC